MSDITMKTIKRRMFWPTIFAVAFIVLLMSFGMPNGKELLFACWVALCLGLFTIYCIWKTPQWARIPSLLFSIMLILLTGPVATLLILGIWNLIAVIRSWSYLNDGGLDREAAYSKQTESE